MEKSLAAVGDPRPLLCSTKSTPKTRVMTQPPAGMCLPPLPHPTDTIPHTLNSPCEHPGLSENTVLDPSQGPGPDIPTASLATALE